MPKIKPEILAHLSKDKKLKAVIEKQGAVTYNTHSDLYTSLLSSIVSQQLSVKAADTIWNRFIDIFPGRDPLPKLVLKKTPEQLRAVGLSFQKAGYLQNIARFALDHGFDHAVLKKMDDDELVEHFTQIKGVGKWTVQMLLMFTMGRMDVFPEDDLGIQMGIKKIYGIDSEKKQLKADMQKIAAKWSPYRTIACRYIWKHKDNTPAVKKK
ncbi:MAG: DNA-3-methyladenine glycosylase [Bacteroidetes bacterium]|nr:DNA-3-methyladenine glycosylase [Bacteroidota bacterium]